MDYSHILLGQVKIFQCWAVQGKIYAFFFNSKEIVLKPMSVEKMKNYLELPKTAAEKMPSDVAEN